MFCPCLLLGENVGDRKLQAMPILQTVILNIKKL